MAAHEQAGDFTVLNVDGRIQRNGGDVATYFCTPCGKVIHAVGKQVSPEKLLAEARWAVDNYHRASKIAGGDARRLQALMAEAHLYEMNTTPESFLAMVKGQLPQERKSYADQKERAYQEKSAYKRKEKLSYLVAPTLQARRWAANRLRGDHAHKILAAEPLAEFRSVEKLMFEKLTNERYASYRSRVLAVGERFKLAKAEGRPILLVVYRGHGKNKSEFDHATKKLRDSVIQDRRVAKVLGSYVVAAVPLSEMAALSTVADIPSYELPGRNPPILIIARPDASPVTTHTGHIEPDRLASMLMPPLNDARMSRAKMLAEGGSHTEAMRLLKRVLGTRPPPDVRDRAQRQVNKVNFLMAEGALNKGDSQRAARYLRRIVKEAVDERERVEARQRIEEIDALKVAAASSLPAGAP